MVIFLICASVISISASSLTSTTPRSALGGNRQSPPWLSPSNPFGGSTEAKSIDSSANRGVPPSTNEEPLPPDIIPYGPSTFGNLSKYGHSDYPSGVHPHFSEADNPSAVVTTTTILPPSSSSSSSNSAVLLSEVNPLVPPGSPSDSEDGNLRVMSSDEDGTLSETDEKPWEKDGVSDVTESLDWSQYERDRSKLDSNGGGVDNMWSDKVEGGVPGGGSSHVVNNNNNNNNVNENALGPVRGVVTVVSPTIFPTRNHDSLDEIDVERNHRYNSPHGKLPRDWKHMTTVIYMLHISHHIILCLHLIRPGSKQELLRVENGSWDVLELDFGWGSRKAALSWRGLRLGKMEVCRK